MRSGGFFLLIDFSPNDAYSGFCQNLYHRKAYISPLHGYRLFLCLLALLGWVWYVHGWNGYSRNLNVST